MRPHKPALFNWQRRAAHPEMDERPELRPPRLTCHEQALLAENHEHQCSENCSQIKGICNDVAEDVPVQAALRHLVASLQCLQLLRAVEAAMFSPAHEARLQDDGVEPVYRGSPTTLGL
ncbi:hypothetical protein WJX74_000093 [Apatococcus lobatus]|uniref:Uncharacterized protein n=1 Tax=Apatococcus lobatus TaxID=904363 RepID=A0AAW1Q6R5_9CHLO